MYMGNAKLNGLFIFMFIKKCKFQRTLANALQYLDRILFGKGRIEETQPKCFNYFGLIENLPSDVSTAIATIS